jgi:hypothetical protein
MGVGLETICMAALKVELYLLPIAIIGVLDAVLSPYPTK